MTKHYHLIGIGGIGMGTIASLLLDKGYKVGGSDVKENSMTQHLRKKGASITIGHNSENIAEADIVVYSSAIKESNCEWAAAQRRGILVLQRAQVLAQLMREHTGITVAGAHGKTTTTSMVGQMLNHAGLNPTSAVGGIINGKSSSATLGHGKYFVSEVDESDGSFLYFNPHYSIITNIDMEHMDYYQTWKNITDTYEKFMANTTPDGLIFVYGDDHQLCELVRKSERAYKTYGFSSKDQVFATNIVMNGFKSTFDCIVNGHNKGSVTLSVPGRHNIANSLACISLGLELNIDFGVICQSLENFNGVQRRFQTLGTFDGGYIVDDYAHHPTEISATLQTAKELSKGRVIGVFQPHRYTRFKSLWREFMDSLKDIDYLIVTDVYEASETPIEGVNSSRFVQELKKITPKTVIFIKKEKILTHVLKIFQPNDLVITLGAGDVNQIGYDLVKELQKKNEKVLHKVNG
ncbi:MAG: UDP-N-acetylmuramate--L-alanine ligase [Candidatus Omnitrophica bacterium]|nr:UDP-N-acetylmuramate--L-alanine ligase [Candidatus Omnitrophota bacterium]